MRIFGNEFCSEGIDSYISYLILLKSFTFSMCNTIYEFRINLQTCISGLEFEKEYLIDYMNYSIKNDGISHS